MKEYIDLGLPSGTLWASENEEDYYTYDYAVIMFWDNMPTKEQWKELIACCEWIWDREMNGYKIVGKNGNSIFLPTYKTTPISLLNFGYYLVKSDNSICITTLWVGRYEVSFDDVSIDEKAFYNQPFAVRLVKS